MQYWIVSSKHSKDATTHTWHSKWKADQFLKQQKFYPRNRQKEFKNNDLCFLKVFGRQHFIASFKIISDFIIDNEKSIYYKIDLIDEFDFPFHQHLLPNNFSSLLSKNSRNSSISISNEMFYELMGIKNFIQNLRLNYKNRIHINISEKDVESFLDSKNSLKKIGLEIIDRQVQITPGNIIDLICKDNMGDLIVIELKKHSPNETIGQLARYVTDVKENYASSAQKVRGIILTHNVDEQLIKAARGVDFDVLIYQLTIG